MMPSAYLPFMPLFNHESLGPTGPIHSVECPSITEEYQSAQSLKRKKALQLSMELERKENEFAKQVDQIELMLKSFPEWQRADALFQLFQRCLNEREIKFEAISRMDRTLRVDPLNVLPPELCIFIFSFLERKDLAKSAQVCIQWRALAYDRTLPLQKLQEGCMYCRHCTTLIAKEDDVLCKKYRLDCSLAYHTAKLYNIELGTVTEKVEYSIGTFDVATACCRSCKTELGIKYIGCHTPDQVSKKGTFLVKKKKLLFPGEPQESVKVVCRSCDQELANDNDIISSSYRLRSNDAYQFATLSHVRLQDASEVDYSSGRYTVAVACCANCDSDLGIKYIQAADGQNGYKVGTFLVEKPKVKIVYRSSSPPSNKDGNDNGNQHKGRKRRSSQLLSSFMSLLRSSK